MERKPVQAMNPEELSQTLELARAGDSQAWGRLFRNFAPGIFRFCRRTLSAREDAEDATSEIFMKLREKIGQYDGTRPFPAWLYKVAANHCWDMLRRRRIRQDLESGEELESLPLAHPDPNQLQRLLSQSSGEQVRAALRQMPARARMALVLRYYAEMSYDEIADSLQVRRAFVGVLLLRARHQLRELLSGAGAAPAHHFSRGHA